MTSLVSFKSLMYLVVFMTTPLLCIQAAVISVSVDGSDVTGDGSYDKPYKTIAKGINEASNGDSVKVMAGTYTGESNRNLRFYGKSITVKGVSGPSSTIIDCGGPDNRAFKFDMNETSGAKLEGFTIRNGNVVDRYENFLPDWNGGAILISSSPVIENCTIQNCTGRVGGGVQVYNSSSVITPSIQYCTFLGNIATQQSGGGISCAKNAQPYILKCEFVSNTAGKGGAIAIAAAESVDVYITQCLFYGNSCNDAGGAIRVHAKANINRSTFAKNDAAGGSALSLEDSANVDFSRNIVAFNLWEGIRCHKPYSVISYSCNCFYENEGGSVVGYCDSTGADSNTIFENPLFCDLDNNDFYISSYSPCDEDSSKCGLLIGRYDNNCTYCCNHDGIRGDVNNDKQGPNVADQTYLSYYLFRHGPPPPCPEEGDVNGNGAINVADVTYLTYYLFFSGPPPPACP